jgi:hypothetical protein
VWVWVDLCPIAGTTAGTFAKAVISNPSAIAGSIDMVTGNSRGFYVTTNPSTDTATLSNATGKFNWCAYGSDFPPNAIDNSSGGYALRGSPPFIITTSSGTTEVNANTFSGGTITALTDATGYPGALCGKNGEAAGLLNCCVYGTTNCSGTCKTNTTYTTNDGACTGECTKKYIMLRNQCSTVVNSQYDTFTTKDCTAGCTNNCASCLKICQTPEMSAFPYASWLPSQQKCRCGTARCSSGTPVIPMHQWVWTAGAYSYSGYYSSERWGCSAHTACN